jgi:hypothetical protein
MRTSTCNSASAIDITVEVEFEFFVSHHLLTFTFMRNLDDRYSLAVNLWTRVCKATKRSLSAGLAMWCMGLLSAFGTRFTPA